jgi:hypothetical protein
MSHSEKSLLDSKKARKIFGQKEVNRGERENCKTEFRHLRFSTNTINCLKVVHGKEGDQEVDGRIILRWIFRKLEGVVGTGWSWLRIGTDGGYL